MSYPPPTRPPMMGGMIPPPPFGFPPMIPPPGMLPGVRPPILPPGMPPLKPIVDRSQATTVFVGNISERAPDQMIRQMLQRCGNVLNWKRAQGANGKLQAFGFCEYDNPDATLRCIRLLNGYEIAEKKILVKVDQKTRDFISEHIKKLRMSNIPRFKQKPRQQNNDDDKGDLNLEYTDENTLKEDRTVLNSFETIIRQYTKDLVPQENIPSEVPTPTSEKPETPSTPTKIETNETMEVDKEKEKIKEKEKEREKEIEKERESRNRSPVDRRRDRSPVKRRISSPYEDRPRSGSTSRRDLDRDLYKENRQEETEEQKERRRLERKLREKELAYRERLEAWESREQKKKYEYSIEKKKEAQKHKILLKEAKKLKQFLEDYDDLKDDAVYYKGSSLEKKLKIREKEIEADNRERAKEKEELEELKRKLSEKGITDFESEAKKIQNNENLRLKKKFEKFDETESSSSEDEQEINESNTTTNGSSTSQLSDLNPNKPEINESSPQLEEKKEERISEAEMTPVETETPGEKNESDDNSMSVSDSPMKMDSPNGSNSPFFSGNLKQNINLTTAVKIRSLNQKNTVFIKNQAFADEEEDQSVAAKKARMLQNMNMEEKKRAVKKLVESIPTDRDELFNFPIDWEQLDDTLMEKRIKPWINKKIIEYIGEEEESLNDFICSKIRQHTKPDRLLEEVKVILDEEAELFVKKMWRLLVYETEAKRLGISK